MSLLNRFKEIRSRSGLTFFDTHIHTHEVLGVMGKAGSFSRNYSASLLERLNFNNFSLTILGLLFRITPFYIRSEIRKKFPSSEDSLVRALTDASIDKATLVPINPNVSPRSLYEDFSSEDFVRLGSPDFSLSLESLNQDLEIQLTQYSIVGIKLHPNIQSFFPHPGKNADVLREKLDLIYRFAEKHKLYLLIHGGISYVPAGGGFELREYGTISNFFDGGIFFLGKLSVPVVIAHLGIYNESNPRWDLIEKIMTYPNIYFDTAGVNPKYIERFLKKGGVSKLLFGSDAMYFNIRHSVESVLNVLYRYSKVDFEKNVISVFSKTYTDYICKK